MDVTGFVQQHLEALSLVVTAVRYDVFSQTIFWMRFDSPGLSDLCSFVSTVSEGDFYRMSCKIHFPAVTVRLRREGPTTTNAHNTFEAINFPLVNISAKAEVIIMLNSTRHLVMRITELNFLNLSDELTTAAKGKQMSLWKKDAVGRAQLLAEQAYLQRNSSSCFI
ncbi:unnamed protein product [Dibothriocephalus latus]|uniref:Uncharacterized protein n=1 Tax=Dibothriocephalus latus TaxID=60516 RepID=A0A3P6R1R6_DIBLA|nr:unnamed protein product [Dibothriocephalus latus]